MSSSYLTCYHTMDKRPPPCSKRELYKNHNIRTSISMSYDQNPITLLMRLFMRVWVGRSY